MFQKGTKVHLIGIKGVGMTALAQILKSRGCKVSGSDTSEVFFTDAVLRRLKIPVTIGFSPVNIPKDADIVVSSAAYIKDNQPLNDEAAEAYHRKLPVLTYPQALGELAKEYKVIAVAGSHGKSTTTALLGWVMASAGLDPVVIVGTKVNKWESNARTGKGKYLVVEADEYREAFLNYQPFGLIITNIDWDHPDYYPSEKEYGLAFDRLANNVKQGGFFVGYGGDKNVKQLLNKAKKRRILTSPFSLPTFHLSIPFPGQHYQLNAAAVLAVAKILKIPEAKALKGIASFPGTARRFEYLKPIIKGQKAVIIDDYAHHPTEIKATLSGARERYPKKRIIAIFQPHMFSRTQALLKNFATAFGQADLVAIMEIFPSAREKAGKVTGKILAEEVRKNHAAAVYLENHASGKQFVKPLLKKDVIILLMGAGDVYKIYS